MNPLVAARRSVVAFAGHMIDAPARVAPRFPPAAETLVAQAIHRELDRLQPAAGVSALASGADTLFAEDLLHRGADLHVLLPLAIPEFIEASVRPAGEPWVQRFHDIVAKATTLEVFGDAYFEGSGTPFQLAALLIDGTAQLLASQGNLEAVTLAVWDAKPGDGLGGAASFVGHAVQQQRRVIAINPATGQTFTPGPEAIAAAQRHSWGEIPMGQTVLVHRLCSFLFADIKGFGRLRETQVSHFIESVVRMIADTLRASGIKPLVLNTWGDGLLVVTQTTADAADIALRLVEAAPSQPPDLGAFAFRVGLHCGPAFFIEQDPITGRPNVYGPDVNLAARIEPVVAAGEVWASRAFVIMSKATSAAGLEFDDLHECGLHKNAGKLCLYRVRRASSSQSRKRDDR